MLLLQVGANRDRPIILSHIQITPVGIFINTGAEVRLVTDDFIR